MTSPTVKTATFAIPTQLTLFLSLLERKFLDPIAIFRNCSGETFVFDSGDAANVDICADDAAGGCLTLALEQRAADTLTVIVTAMPGHWLVTEFSTWLAAHYPGVSLPALFLSDAEIDAAAGALLVDESVPEPVLSPDLQMWRYIVLQAEYERNRFQVKNVAFCKKTGISHDTFRFNKRKIQDMSVDIGAWVRNGKTSDDHTRVIEAIKTKRESGRTEEPEIFV